MNAITETASEAAIPVSVRERMDGPPDSATGAAKLITIWRVLRFTFGLVPIVAGLDKFTNLLVNWETYLNPLILRLFPLGGHAFMSIVGVIEIFAGILTLARPRLGGYIVSAWLVCIAFSLIASGRYFDVAVRDLVMAVGAFTLANLTATITKINQGRSR